jgi:single-strand DNA-binding protein
MADIIQVMGIGRLTRDATVTFTSGGMAIASFAVAVNRKTKKGDQWIDEASFFDVKLFGKTAENLTQYLTKGKQIGFSGSLVQERWQGQDGQNHSRVVINADNVQLLGGDRNSQGSQTNAKTGGSHASEQGFNDDAPFIEEIPF